MRTTAITIVSLVLFVSLPAFRALPGEPEAAATAVARGQAHVEKTCVGCHAGAQLDALVGRRLDAKGPMALERFLETHHVPDKAIRADMVSYFRTRLRDTSPQP